MRTRQLQRWCDVCKMRVFALGHEHGQSAGPKDPDRLIGLTENADAARGTNEANVFFYATREKAMAEAQAILKGRLESAVAKLDK